MRIMFIDPLVRSAMDLRSPTHHFIIIILFLSVQSV